MEIEFESKESFPLLPERGLDQPCADKDNLLYIVGVEQ